MTIAIVIKVIKIAVDGLKSISSTIRTGTHLKEARDMFVYQAKNDEEKNEFLLTKKYISAGYQDINIDVFDQEKKKNFIEKIKQNLQPKNISSNFAKPFVMIFDWLSKCAANRLLGVISAILNIILNIITKGGNWAQESISDFLKLGNIVFIHNSMEYAKQSLYQEKKTKASLAHKIGQLHAKIKESKGEDSKSSYLHEQKLDEKDINKIKNKWYVTNSILKRCATYGITFCIFLALDIFFLINSLIKNKADIENVINISTFFIDLISKLLNNLGIATSNANEEQKNDMILMVASKYFGQDIEKITIQSLRETYIADAIKLMVINVNNKFAERNANYTIELYAKDIDMNIVKQYLKAKSSKDVVKNEDGSITVTKQGYLELKLRAFLADYANKYEYSFLHNPDSLFASIKNVTLLPLILQKGEINCIGEGFKDKEKFIKNIQFNQLYSYNNKIFKQKLDSRIQI
jgi:hypothetical protein